MTKVNCLCCCFLTCSLPHLFITSPVHLFCYSFLFLHLINISSRIKEQREQKNPSLFLVVMMKRKVNQRMRNLNLNKRTRTRRKSPRAVTRALIRYNHLVLMWFFFIYLLHYDFWFLFKNDSFLS